MRNLLDTVAPERLGRGFRWLLASSWLSNTGNGISIAAGPLLVASLTGNAFLIALAALLQWLPPLAFGLWAGALFDQVNRKLIVGSRIGGLLAQHIGLAAPFWFAFAGSGLFVVLIWNQLKHIAHDDPRVEPESAVLD